MNSIKNCGNCKHFSYVGKYTSTYRDKLIAEVEYGKCCNIKNLFNQEKQTSTLTNEYIDEDNGLEVGIGFGCIHYGSKDE